MVPGTCVEIDFGHVAHSVTRSKLMIAESAKSIFSNVGVTLSFSRHTLPGLTDPVEPIIGSVK
jgi:hypothetical protein